MGHSIFRSSVAQPVTFVLMLISACASPVPRPVAQNPSPMVEHTRTHVRIFADDIAAGDRHTLEGLLPAAIRVFVPEGTDRMDARLLIHFHGSAFPAEHATAASATSYVAANVHLGAGSAAYERPFTDPSILGRIIDEARRTAQVDTFRAVVLSGFSAGYGAIRAILRDSTSTARIEGVILLDGLHTGYVPDGRVLHDGGRLDAVLLEPFLRFARLSMQGSKRFLITHSEIFPGTFASTTETTDHIVDTLVLERTAVLEWGPVGMQQLSVVRAGSFEILGFAGNTAPDHVDHFHGLPAFLERYDSLALLQGSR
ncbi:MAG: hypothetical protein KFH98_14320 [Gemmatimonadetes bacterium]|nr:hypothetical protein [Gemmatimonadota bacterium]